MDTYADMAETIKKATDLYVETLSAAMKRLEGLQKQTGAEHRRLVEQWIRLTRMSLDGAIAVLEQGFALWEAQCRRLIGASTRTESGGAPPNPFEVWAESLRRAAATFAPAATTGDAWSAEVRKQVELVQQSLQEGLRAWQRLWEPPEAKS
jgi:hypothetical protein